MLVDAGVSFQFNSSCVGHGARCPILTSTLVSAPADREHGAVGAALTNERCFFRFVGNNELRCEIAVSFKAVFSTKVPLNLMKT